MNTASNTRTTLPAFAVVTLLMALPTLTAAQTAPSAKTTGAKAASSVQVSKSRAELQSEAKGLALATDVTETISDRQLDISNRVLTGTAQCEFNQTVDVRRVQDKPGHFRVQFKNVAYLMTPEETTTGAVRLVDRRQRVVWLQIPSKSMMMDQGAGRRMVDSCQQTEQRIASEASKSAGQSSLLK